MEHALVIGIGTGSRGDGSLGLHMVQRLRKESLPGMHLMEAAGEGTELIRMWNGYDRVIVVRAFSSGSTPGLLHAIDASITTVSPRLFRASGFSFGLPEAIALSRRLGILPSALFVCGIEGTRFTDGSHLSGAVREKIGDLLEVIIGMFPALHPQEFHGQAEPLDDERVKKYECSSSDQ